MKNLFARFIAAATVSCAAASAAHAAPVTVGFDTINGACSYAESDFLFACSGNHTDATEALNFHDNGANPGNNDITVTFSGGNFKAVSLQLLGNTDGLLVADNFGHSVAFGAGTTGVFQLTGFNNVSWLKLSTEGDTGVILDDFAFDDPTSDVPEPGSLALLGLGLMGALAARRKRSN